MGDTLQREFSLNPVQTGTQPSTPSQLSPNFSTPGASAVSAGTPGAPTTRPSFLQAFLANLPQALAGGMQPDARGNVNFSTGLSGSIRGIEHERDVQFQHNLMQQEQQRLQQQAISTQALQAAQTSRLQQTTPGEVEAQNIQNQIAQNNLNFFKDPNTLNSTVDNITKSLGTLSPEEQSALDAAKVQAQMSRKLDPISQAVDKIYTQRSIFGRMAVNQSPATQAFRALTWLQNPSGPPPQLQGKPQDIVDAFKKLVDIQGEGAAKRYAGLLATRVIPIIDDNGNMTMMTGDMIAKSLKSGGIVTPATQGGKLMQTYGQIANTQQAINAVRPSLALLDNPSTRRQLAVLSAQAKSQGLTGQAFWNYLVQGGGARSLSPGEAQFFGQMARLRAEMLGVLRNAFGQSGQMSDLQREVDLTFGPNMLVDDSRLANAKLDALQQSINTAKEHLPGISTNPKGRSGSTPPPGANVILLNDFLKKH